MTLLSLLYVSRSTIDAALAETVVADIVETAGRVNLALELTGALIFTGAHFAQILEGPTGAVDTLMTSIAADTRHRNILIVDRLPVQSRSFDQWSMAYFGRVRFVERHITDLIETPSSSDRSHSSKLLRKLMHEFSVQHVPALRGA
ncbi:BLUF domain-containing protein [Sphingomonas faeni]|uniref:BLUF domain-containing protein n=1 Tax=Sphingomonas faeni TaxID=185950 RepID=UPI0020C77830|nr:BLUF domain-containing protein [Sphingomonas faeni]MCP8891613.1 BLUF domain-containing protein [Sphingomonas faeni]